MNIGVLGTGIVGQTLGRGFATHGHRVMLGSRDPSSEKVQQWVRDTGHGVAGGTFADAARFGEVLVLATSWDGAENAVRLAGAENARGKVVIDATNPLDFSQGPPPRLAVKGDDSAGERVQRWLPGARVVKAFNTVGNVSMVDPKFPGGAPDMFICGNDAEAKKVVDALCRDLGWPGTLDIGGIDGARYLEAMAIVWIRYGFLHQDWGHAFKLLRKS